MSSSTSEGAPLLLHGTASSGYSMMLQLTKTQGIPNGKRSIGKSGATNLRSVLMKDTFN